MTFMLRPTAERLLLATSLPVMLVPTAVLMFRQLTATLMFLRPQLITTSPRTADQLGMQIQG